MRMEDDHGSVFSIYPAISKKDEVAIYASHPEGDITEVIFGKQEVDQIVDALYGALGLEVVPLRDELLAFMKWHDPYFNASSNPHDDDVDNYLEFVQQSDSEPNFESDSSYQDAE